MMDQHPTKRCRNCNGSIDPVAYYVEQTSYDRWGNFSCTCDRKEIVTPLSDRKETVTPLSDRKEPATPEPEFTAKDGTVRKLHYGSGRQPWDDIVDAGWGPAFAAGNALKYIRRHHLKGGADDIAKGQWYYNQLNRLTKYEYGIRAIEVLNQLDAMLTSEERSILHDGLTY